MRRALLPVTIVLFVTPIAVALAAQPGPDEYAGVVEEYRIGDANAALRRLASWPRPVVTDSVGYWAPLFRPGQLVAAAVLHTELAAALVNSTPSTAAFHLTFARSLLRTMAAHRDERERASTITERWFQFVVAMYVGGARLDEAEQHVRDGLSQFPRDAILYFNGGVILEAGASFDQPDPEISPGRLTLSRGRALNPAIRRQRKLEAAATEYRNALDLDPRMAIARLHLGWVRVALHDDRAQTDLESALADATDDRVRYFAHLFLGGLAERQQRLADAVREYEQTYEIGPTHQTPYVALSRLEVALGHGDRARALARQWAELRRVDDDPWWIYPLDPVDGGALAWLRAEAHRR